MGIILHGTDVSKAKTLDQILGASQLDYDVSTTGIQTADGTTIPGRQAIVHGTTGEVLGLVTDSYVAKSPRDSFGIVDDLLASGRATGESAGPLRNGKEAFIQLKLDRESKIGGDDGETVANYLFMHTGMDGHHALSGILGPIRLSCTNMIPFASTRADSLIRFSHTTSIEKRLEQAAQTLNLIDESIDQYEETANGLLLAKFTTPQMRSFLSRLIPIAKDANPDKDRAARSKQEARDAIMAIFANGDNLANVRETKWAAYNAVAEYFDHTVSHNVRGGDGDQETIDGVKSEARFFRVLEDTKLKDRAFALLAA